MLIQKIEIENYKGISNLKFSPKKLNIIVGKNNTGKTSVLDAINLLFHNNKLQGMDMFSYFNIYSKEKLSKIFVDTNMEKKSIIIQESQPNDVIIKFAEDILSTFFKELYRSSNIEGKSKFGKSVTKDLENVIINNMDDEIRSSLIKNSLTFVNEEKEHSIYYWINQNLIEKLSPIMRKLVNQVKKVIPKEGVSSEGTRNLLRNLEFAELRTLYMLQWKVSSRLDLTDEDSNVLFITSILKNFETSFQKRHPKDSEKIYQIEKTLKDHNLISNLERLDFDNVLLKTDYGIKEHAISFLGDGFKCIIALLWFLSSQKKDSIVLFDEPEEHMHPGYIRELVEFFVKFSRESDIQFFMTTHSSDLLDLFLSEDLEKKDKEYIEKELRVLRLDKVKNSITLAECLNYNQCIETKEELLLDLRGV